MTVYPKPLKLTVEKPSILREFIAGLGEETLYAYDRRVVGVSVNGRRPWGCGAIGRGGRGDHLPRDHGGMIRG